MANVINNITPSRSPIVARSDATTSGIKYNNAHHVKSMTHNHGISTILSAREPEPSRNWTTVIFSPFVYIWRLVSNCISGLFNRRCERVDENKLFNVCKSELIKLKEAIEQKDAKACIQVYKNLPQEARLLVENIYFRHASANMEVPGNDMGKYICNNPIAPAFAQACNIAIRNFELRMEIHPFAKSVATVVDHIHPKPGQTRSVHINSKPTYDQFCKLSKEAQELIKHVIWKKLAPQNNNDPDFGGTFVKNNIHTISFREVLKAVDRGLSLNDDREKYCNLMP